MNNTELLENIIEDMQGWEVVDYTNQEGIKEPYLQVEFEEQLLEMDLQDITDISILTKETLAKIIIDKYMD